MKIYTIILLLLSFLFADHYSDDGDLARWSVRREMERNLRTLPKSAHTQIDQLLAKIKNQDANKRIQVLQSLAKLSRGNDKVVSAVINLLHDEDDTEVKIWAILALGDIGVKKPVVISSLHKLAIDKNIRVRRAVSMALTEIGAYDEINSLAAHNNELLREVAARSFVNMGRKAKKFFHKIDTLSKDTNVRVRREARWALNIITSSDVFYEKEKDLILAAQNSDKKIHIKAFSSLIELGADAIPVILEMTKSENENVREQAKKSLKSIQKQQQLAILSEKQKIQKYIQYEQGPSSLFVQLNGSFQTAVGQKNTYTLSVTNIGTKVVYNTDIMVSLPDNFEYRGRAGSTLIMWNLSSLKPNKERKYVFEGTALLKGEDRFTIRLEQNGEQKMNSHYPYVVTEGSLVQKNNEPPIRISIDSTQQLLLGEKGVYKITIENAGTSPLKNVAVEVKLPFNSMYKTYKYSCRINYIIDHLDKSVTYPFEVKALCAGSGYFDVTVVDNKQRKKISSFPFEVASDKASHHRILAAQNEHQIDMQSSMSAKIIKIGGRFICRTSIHNQSKQVKSIMTEVHTASNINCPERGAERHHFSWVNTIRSGARSNYFIPLNGLGKGKGKVVVKGIVDGKEVFVAEHMIDVK